MCGGSAVSVRAYLFFILALTVLWPAPADAQTGFRVRSDEACRRLDDLDVPNAASAYVPAEWTFADAYIGRRVRNHRFLLLGVFVGDLGYAICREGSDTYWALDDEQVRLAQTLGVLPTPMPRKTLTGEDLVFGYSLWWVLAAAGGVVAVRTIRKQRDAGQVDRAADHSDGLLHLQIAAAMARANGPLDEEGRRRLSSFASRRPDLASADDAVDRVLSDPLTKEQLFHFVDQRAEKMDQLERELLLLAALAGADKMPLKGGRKDFFAGLVHAMGYERAHADDIAERLKGRAAA